MKRFDHTIWLGLGIGLLAIMAGAWLEGLSFSFLLHPTAALIVGGGTLGAVIVRRGIDGVKNAVWSVWELRHQENVQDHKIELEKLIWLSRSVQKSGIKALENYADNSNDPLITEGLLLVAEYADKQKIKEVINSKLDLEYELGLQDVATLDAAGGFAPTFGILGAVLGLIGVLRVLDRPDALGIGIATAFVATIYGIGVANLFFFPLAARLRARHESYMRRREEIALVILALASKESARSIANRFNLR